MLEVERALAAALVRDGVHGSALFHRIRPQHTARDARPMHAVGTAVGPVVDQDGELDRIRNELRLRGLDRLDHRLAGVRVAVDNGDGAALEREARGVLELDGRQRISRSRLAVVEQNGSAPERLQHDRHECGLVPLDRDRARDRVLEEVADLPDAGLHVDGTDHAWLRRRRHHG